MESNFGRTKNNLPAAIAAGDVRMRSFKETSELRGNGSRIFPDRHFNPRKRTLPTFQLSVAIGMRSGKKANSACVRLSRAESRAVAKWDSKRPVPLSREYGNGKLRRDIELIHAAMAIIPMQNICRRSPPPKCIQTRRRHTECATSLSRPSWH